MKLSGIVKEVKLVKLGEIDAFLVGLEIEEKVIHFPIATKYLANVKLEEENEFEFNCYPGGYEPTLNAEPAENQVEAKAEPKLIELTDDEIKAMYGIDSETHEPKVLVPKIPINLVQLTDEDLVKQAKNQSNNKKKGQQQEAPADVDLMAQLENKLANEGSEAVDTKQNQTESTTNTDKEGENENFEFPKHKSNQEPVTTAEDVEEADEDPDLMDYNSVF